jgi:hypothetical protein
VNLSNLKLAGKGERIRCSIRAQGSRCAYYLFKLLDSVSDGYEFYMRWPGEKVPNPPSSSPHRGGQADWKLAA